MKEEEPKETGQHAMERGVSATYTSKKIQECSTFESCRPGMQIACHSPSITSHLVTLQLSGQEGYIREPVATVCKWNQPSSCAGTRDTNFTKVCHLRYEGRGMQGK